MELIWFKCKDCGRKGYKRELYYEERCPNCASENIELKHFDDSNPVVDFVMRGLF